MCAGKPTAVVFHDHQQQKTKSSTKTLVPLFDSYVRIYPGTGHKVPLARAKVVDAIWKGAHVSVSSSSSSQNNNIFKSLLFQNSDDLSTPSNYRYNIRGKTARQVAKEIFEEEQLLMQQKREEENELGSNTNKKRFSNALHFLKQVSLQHPQRPPVPKFDPILSLGYLELVIDSAEFEIQLQQQQQDEYSFSFKDDQQQQQLGSGSLLLAASAATSLRKKAATTTAATNQKSQSNNAPGGKNKNGFNNKRLSKQQQQQDQDGTHSPQQHQQQELNPMNAMRLIKACFDDNGSEDKKKPREDFYRPFGTTKTPTTTPEEQGEEQKERSHWPRPLEIVDETAELTTTAVAAAQIPQNTNTVHRHLCLLTTVHGATDVIAIVSRVIV